MPSSQEKARKKSINLLFIRIVGPLFSVFMFLLINFEVNLEPKSIKNILNILIFGFAMITALLQSVTTARLFNSFFGLALLIFVGLKFTNWVPNKFYVITVTELIVYSVVGMIFITIGNLNKISK